MREIKFRAYVIEDKAMCKVLGIDFWQGVVLLEYKNENRFFLDSKKIKLMQYTGIRDKNGEEIYEGDIVKWIDVLNRERYSWVFYQDGAFRIESKFTIGQYNELEVIDNIYENKDLLEEE